MMHLDDFERAEIVIALEKRLKGMTGGMQAMQPAQVKRQTIKIRKVSALVKRVQDLA